MRSSATDPDVPSPAGLRWSGALRDGTPVEIRPLGPRDRQAEADFIEGLSPESRRFRFMGQFAHPSDALVRRLTSPDFVRDAAYAAVPAGEERGPLLGVARFAVDADGKRCECAVVVADAWQGKGLATALLQHLVRAARAMGLEEMYSIDPPANARLRTLARNFGFTCSPDPGNPGQLVHTLAL